jgi:hypothetical protein
LIILESLSELIQLEIGLFLGDALLFNQVLELLRLQAESLIQVERELILLLYALFQLL